MLGIDAARVGVKLFSCVHAAPNGATLVDLRLHMVNTTHRAILGDEILCELFDRFAHTRSKRLL